MNDCGSESLYYDFLETDLGFVIMAVNAEGFLCHAAFQDGPKMIVPPGRWEHNIKKLTEPIRQMSDFFAGKLERFQLPLAPAGTEFQQMVWTVLTEIPYGETITYGELARRIGKPQAGRAVGNANGRNPIVIIQPCHRVVAAGGKLGGFSSGLHRKEYLLRLERRISLLF
jgi:methylated-DNA-[protein]-cysteine S-methyltransferase